MGKNRWIGPLASGVLLLGVFAGCDDDDDSDDGRPPAPLDAAGLEMTDGGIADSDSSASNSLDGSLGMPRGNPVDPGDTRGDDDATGDDCETEDCCAGLDEGSCVSNEYCEPEYDSSPYGDCGGSQSDYCSSLYQNCVWNGGSSGGELPPGPRPMRLPAPSIDAGTN